MHVVSTSSHWYSSVTGKKAVQDLLKFSTSSACVHMIQSPCFNRAAVTAPTLITAKSYFDILGNSDWSPSRHTLGDMGITHVYLCNITS